MNQSNYLLGWVTSAALLTLGTPRAAASSLHPLILQKSTGSLSVETSNQLLALTSDAFSDGILVGTARGIYGTDPTIFPAASPYRGQVEMLGDILQRIDQSMQRRMAAFSKRSEGYTEVVSEVFWTKSNLGESVLGNDISEMLILSLSQYLPPPRANGDSTTAWGSLGTKALRTRTTNYSQQLSTQLKQETIVNFPALAELSGANPLWPVYSLIELNLNGKKGVRFALKFVFMTQKMTIGQTSIGTTLLDKLVYSPALQGLGVVELNFERDYLFDQATTSPAIATITFGRLNPVTMGPTSCSNNDCLKWIDALPTMYISIDPARAGWFTRTKAWLASFDEFQILFRSITLNLSDLSLDPKGSELIFIVDSLAGGRKAIDMQNSVAGNWYEYYAQRQGAIDGNILPTFDAFTRRSLDELMQNNLDALIFQPKK